MSGTVEGTDNPPDHLLCGVCDKILQRPRLLPCLHSACHDCLQRILDTNKTTDCFECPKCEEAIDITGHDANDFPLNEYLYTVISVYYCKHNTDKSCVICDMKKKNSIAKYKCLDCEDFLCEACGDAHSSTRMTIDHNVLSLDELGRGSHDDTVREKRLMHCKEHEKEILDHYCTSCNHLVCRECRLGDHFDHHAVPVHEVDESKRDKIHEMVDRLDIKIKDLFDADVECEAAIRELYKSEQIAIEEVENTSKQLKERIESEKTELIESVKQYVATEKDRCNQQKTDINRRHAVLSYGSDISSDIAAKSKEAEVIYMEPALSERLTYLDRLPQPKTDVKYQIPEVKLRNLYGNVENMKFFEFTPAAPNSTSYIASGVEESNIPKVVCLNLKRKINVFLPDDETSPKITGLCIMKNELYVSDYANRKIKIFSLKGEHIHTMPNIGAFSIAGFDDVIAVSDHFAVTMISTDESMRFKIDQQSTSGSYPLATLHGNTFIVANNQQQSFMTYDKHGRFIETYKMARSTRKSFSRAITSLTTTSTGSIVASDWGTNAVVVMGTDGKLKLEYTAKPLSFTKDWSPGGVCVDIHDNMFLIDQRQSNVTVLNPTGKVIYRHNTKKDGLDRPLNIATDNNSCLFISGKAGLIHVYLTEYL